jgi:hypothetical protein
MENLNKPRIEQMKVSKEQMAVGPHPSLQETNPTPMLRLSLSCRQARRTVRCMQILQRFICRVLA